MGFSESPVATFFTLPRVFTATVSCTVFLVFEEVFFRLKKNTAALERLIFANSHRSISMNRDAMGPPSLPSQEQGPAVAARVPPLRALVAFVMVQLEDMDIVY